MMDVATLGVHMRGWEMVHVRNHMASQNILRRTRGPDRMVENNEVLGMLCHVLHVV